MATKVHLIMPMGGRGSRFSNEGFDFPKPLIQIYNNPFFIGQLNLSLNL